MMKAFPGAFFKKSVNYIKATNELEKDFLFN